MATDSEIVEVLDAVIRFAEERHENLGAARYERWAEVLKEVRADYYVPVFERGTRIIARRDCKNSFNEPVSAGDVAIVLRRDPEDKDGWELYVSLDSNPSTLKWVNPKDFQLESPDDNA